MIGRITGKLLDKKTPELLIDVQGVGYEVLVSLTTFFELPVEGESTTLHTHFVVREDAQQLFGFGSLGERGLFRSLIKVNGVGPKMAIAILSGMNSNEFVRCVETGDVASLVKLPGVGKKTAERLVIEMRDRVAGLSSNTASASPEAVTQNAQKDSIAEAETALITLGYKPQEAARMVSAVNKGDENLDTATLIRLSLKSVVKK